jgi:hypothetical protein
MNSWINLTALWKIVVVGLLAGRAASAGSPGLALAVLCFAVVLAAIGWGIYSIVSHS